ncbi:MAG TPA: SEC-C domain-containing protein, partial [Pseudonocardia sp.]
RDAAAFAEPRPPLSELAEAAGLERRGGDFAHDPSVWLREQDFQRRSRMAGRLDAYAEQAMEAFELLTDDARDPAALREALDLMEDPEVLSVVVDELLGAGEEPQRVRDLVELADRLLTVAGRSVRGAVAAAVAAIAAERDRRPLDAESHLRGAVRTAPEWEFTADRLAWYESDRGDAAAALELWAAIGAPPDVPEVAELRRFAVTAEHQLGRNEPCWCGSGRKFKQCHRGRSERAPLAERVGWLTRKAVAYVSRRGGLTSDLAPYLLARHPDLDDVAAPDPLVMDVVLVEGGLFARFVADRGPLLPEDELLLAEAWLLVERTVYEVTAVEAGHGVAVRDLRTGDRLDVRDRAFAAHAAVGELVCARAVPDGTGLQFVGVPFVVEPGTEQHVMALLGDRDGIGLLEWAADRAADPPLVSALLEEA